MNHMNWKSQGYKAQPRKQVTEERVQYDPVFGKSPTTHTNNILFRKYGQPKK